MTIRNGEASVELTAAIVFEREGNLAGFQVDSLLLRKLTGAAVPIVCFGIELFRHFVLTLLEPTSE